MPSKAAEGRRRGLEIEIAWFELLLSVSGPESAFTDTVMVGAATSVGASTSTVDCVQCPVSTTAHARTHKPHECASVPVAGAAYAYYCNGAPEFQNSRIQNPRNHGHEHKHAAHAATGAQRA